MAPQAVGGGNMKALEVICATIAFIAYLIFVLYFCRAFGMWWAFLWVLVFPVVKYNSGTEEKYT
jgi:fatty acid desaturase